MKQMLAGLTQLLNELGLSWKPSSLESLQVNRAADQCMLYQLPGSYCSLGVKAVPALQVLGDRIDRKGSTAFSVEFRLEQAENAKYAKAALWDSRGGKILKMRAWETLIQPVVLFGSETWELTSHILHRIRT